MAEKLVSIKGSVPVNKHKFIGHAEPKDRIEATIKLRRASEEGLPTLEEFVRGKRSAGITRQILAERYAAKREDADAVQRWAARQALSVSRVDLARRQMHVVGSADAMSRAFGVKLSMYRHSRTGSQFRCPESNIKVPESLAPIITGVFGLNDMPVVVRHAKSAAATKTAKAVKKDPKAQFPGSFYPNEVAKLYNFPATQGAGQRVAVLEFGGGVDQSVLADYFTNNIGLKTPPVVNPISVLGAPIQVDPNVTGEVYLDIEVVGAMAPKATMDVYFAPWTGEGYLNAIEQAIHNDDYAAVSISYGLDEDLRGSSSDPGWPALNQHIDEAFRDATALGIPIFVSSGDQGSSSLRGQAKIGSQPVEVTQYSPSAHAGYPATSPYATAVGGTMLYAEKGAISKEIVWNELGPLQKNQFYFGGATGGGVSDRYTEVPTYQSNAGVVPQSVNKPGVKGRGIPDVAGNAGSTTGYLVSQPPGAPLPVMPVGGTSAAAPMWAALMCCVREALEAKFNGKVPTFFFNDFVYENGKTAAFRDITGGREFTLDAKGQLVPGAFTDTGNNRSTKADGYQAGPGYDLCTGWGSPNGVELVNQLATWLASGKNGGKANVTTSSRGKGPSFDVEDVRLNFNPEKPQARFKDAGLEAAHAPAGSGLPGVVPWPAGTAPTPQPLSKAPAETADLSQFRGYDAIIVTWTSAEAAALAALMSPGHTTSDWYEYRHGIANYIPLVTGSRAPFNDKQADMARYYHSLGLYFPCTIGKAKVLLFKSGLHLDYDGPQTPVKKLMSELVDAINPKVFITTGTGGAIGADVALGDVVIAGVAQFDCPTQFKNEPWASAKYKTTPVPAEALAAITPALTKVNAARIPNARPTPKIWASASDAIVTTDFFGFDDSTDHYKLQAPGHRACDMGDAMVGQAMAQHPSVKWFAIRNASDPQMPNPNNDINAAEQEAGNIYAKYGGLTTAASVIASWAVVNAIANK